MAFISSKFNMPTRSGSGLTGEAYADLYLTNLATAFSTACSDWSIYSNLETIGTNRDTNYGCRTLQLYSSTSNKYVRVWCFANTCTGRFQDNSSSSGGNSSADHSNLYIYRGNLFRINGVNGVYFGCNYSNELVFAVSDNQIAVDFADDLGLSVSMFSFANAPTDSNSQYLSYGSTHGCYVNGGVITVITDGKFFGVMRKLSSDTGVNACFYAPDMIVCANGVNDQNTEGVISCQDRDDNFYLGNNSPYDIESYVKVIFNDANGGHDFRGWGEGIYSGKDSCQTSENSAYMSCTAIKVFLNTNSYSGSTMPGIIPSSMPGINFKGWVNPNYVRSANLNVLPESSKGMTYDNKNWLCTAAGTLICWNALNTSPFEAAV